MRCPYRRYLRTATANPWCVNAQVPETSESDDSDEGPQSGEDGSNDETIADKQVVESDEDVSNDESSTDQKLEVLFSSGTESEYDDESGSGGET